MIRLSNFVIKNGLLIRYNGYDADIEIPDTVRVIGNSAFSFSKEVVSIKVPKSVTEIKDGAFFNCISLKKIDLTESPAKISGKTFLNCQSLEEIAVSEKNKHYKSIGGVL